MQDHMNYTEIFRSYDQRQKMSKASNENGATAPDFNVGDNVMLHVPRANRMYFSYSPGYVITGKPSADFYTVAKTEANGSLSKEEKVPVARLRPVDVSRTPDLGISFDLKPEHLVLESIVGHKKSSSGRYTFIVKWKGIDEPSRAELKSLMKNCEATLRAYCKSQAKPIPWSHLVNQRAEMNKLDAELSSTTPALSTGAGSSALAAGAGTA